MSDLLQALRSPINIAVSGYYGCGNAGDEAVLAGIRAAFARRAGEQARLFALSQDPEATTRLHGIPSVNRMSLSAMRSLLKQCDLLLSGGGSLLQDTTSMRSLLYYLFVCRLAYSMRVPFMFYAQGLGPLRRGVSRTLVRMVANRAACITVRDAASAQLLAQIGVTRPPIEVTADPAFALTPAAPSEVDTLMAREGFPLDAPLLGVALRPWGGAGESPIPAYAALLTELERQSGAQVVLLPMHVPDDVEFGEQVMQAAGGAFPTLRSAYPPETLLGLVGRMQAVVAMRLHTLIFAARVGVPPFALAYDPKVESLMRSLDLRDALESWRGFDPAEVAERVAALLTARASRVAALRVQTADLEQRALRNADRALALFPSPR
ncbi:MAG TPA: polysaccharide pyruvyl transferase CsaB [Chthonomonadaceae bacterium]|nr:polysaccharide pyruvyl transferase CsaB [Chthonomonadaceae bacterium]